MLIILKVLHRVQSIPAPCLLNIDCLMQEANWVGREIGSRLPPQTAQLKLPMFNEAARLLHVTSCYGMLQHVTIHITKGYGVLVHATRHVIIGYGIILHVTTSCACYCTLLQVGHITACFH